MFIWLMFPLLELVTLVLYHSHSSGVEYLDISPSVNMNETQEKMNIFSPTQHSETSKEKVRERCFQLCFNPRENKGPGNRP